MPTLSVEIPAASYDGYYSTTDDIYANDKVWIFDRLGVVYEAWLYFPLNLNRNVVITSAYITLTWKLNFAPGTNEAIEATIEAEDADNPSPPVDRADCISRVRTTNNTVWEVPNQGANNTTVNTPSLVSVVQEVINRGGWGAGNNIGFFFRPTDKTGDPNRSWYDYAQDSGRVATLHIEYEETINVEHLEFYLIPHVPSTVFTGRVNVTPEDPYIDIAFREGVTGSFGEPIAGQSVWFGTSAGGQERGVLRLRSKTEGAASGTVRVAESDDVGPTIRANDHITIKEDMRLWPKYPRFVQSQGGFFLNGTRVGAPAVFIYQDYDNVYSAETDSWRPQAVAGPPAVAFLEGGQAQISFVGDRSFALNVGGWLTNWLWTARGSSELTSTSQGTEGSPVTFTWTTPGWHLVSLKVTDTNGVTHTNYTWVVIIDPASPTDYAFLDFDPISDNIDFETGGAESSFVVRGDISISEFPEEMMVLHVARGDITTATGSWPNRSNVLFVGYVLSGTVRQNPEQGDVSFRAGTIDALMKNLTVFPVSLTDKRNGTGWTSGKSLTADRTASVLWKYWSTLDQMTPIVNSGYAGLIRRQDFGPSDLYSQLDSELMRTAWGRVVSTHQSVLYHLIDYNLQIDSERATATTRKRLHKGVWVNDVSIEERPDYSWPANRVKASGIYYVGGEVTDICPLFSEAPGDAPKVYGKELNYDRLILLGQNDLNIRTGYALAKANPKYPFYRMEFINDGSFTVAPQELFPTVIESGDNDRGLSLTPNLIPRRINRTYDHAGGFFIVSVDFEPETSGPAGVTVEVDCTPPGQNLPDNNEPETPDTPEGITGKISLAAGTTGTSWYFAPGVDQSWEKRVTGLIDPDQLTFNDFLADPWSAFKQGYSPERIIIWGCGPGFLARSENSGKNWIDRSGYLEQPSPPAWPGETGTALSSVAMIGLQADIFSEDRLFVLAAWQYEGDWHGAVAKTSNGFDFTWHNITGSAQVRPLGLSLDKGAGNRLYITTWESDNNLYVNEFDPGDMTLQARQGLGGATEGEVDSQSYFANPFNRNLQAGELFVFGRMAAPVGATGSVAVLKSDGGVTGSWAVVENDWGADVCGSFGADREGYYYAVRQA